MTRPESSQREFDEFDSLVSLAVQGDRRTLGRLLTVIERGGEGADAVDALLYSQPGHGHRERSHVIGVTGAPGTGKSTLTGCLLETLTSTGKRPAVLAVDPSSPLSGGALLGDRIRVDNAASAPESPSVIRSRGSTSSSADSRPFIRSMATRGHGGGLALAVPAALRVFEACGYDPILVETAGVGQVELDVTSAADTTVVVLAPQMGDAIQANKAGLLEVADVLVVNKADLPRASDVRRDLEHMLDLGRATATSSLRSHRPEVLMTVAASGEGIDGVWRAIRGHHDNLVATGEITTRRTARIRQEIADRITRNLSDAAESLMQPDGGALSDALCERVSPSTAAAEITASLLRDSYRPSG